MKYAKLSVMAIFAVVIMSCIVFATQSLKFTLEEHYESMLPQVEKHLQPPENATVIPELEPISFDLSLDTQKISVLKGQSLKVTVTVYSMEEVDLLLTVGTEDYPANLALMGLQPELPPGIMTSFDRTEISVKARQQTTVKLTLSTNSQTTSGIYTLRICAIRKTDYGSASVGVPLQLTIS